MMKDLKYLIGLLAIVSFLVGLVLGSAMHDTFFHALEQAMK